MELFGTARVDETGCLELGGCKTEALAREYGTPLYIMDEAHIRGKCKLFKRCFHAEGIETEVVYAGKAFLTLGMCQLVEEEGLFLDVVSGGELYTALKAGFPVARLLFHGNNKTQEELNLAIEADVGRIIVDNCHELRLIKATCRRLDKRTAVLLRVNPDIDGGAQDFVKTATAASKFGLAPWGAEMGTFFRELKDCPQIDFLGLHCHIGSQILEAEPFYKGVEIMLTLVEAVNETYGLRCQELNLGGGFGVYYAAGDQALDLPAVLGGIVAAVAEKTRGWPSCPRLMIEPGRGIVANAGVTLYRVGGVKRSPGGQRYVLVDGGMNDNIRTALYDARYEAVLANRMTAKSEHLYTVAGKCCESGDVLVKDALLPKPKPGDLLAVLSTGAYNYSMASNYNRLPKPAVVLVKGGCAQVLVKREDYEDVIRNDAPIKGRNRDGVI